MLFCCRVCFEYYIICCLLTFQGIAVTQQTIAQVDVNLRMETAHQTSTVLELVRADQHLVMPTARRESVALLRYDSCPL